MALYGRCYGGWCWRDKSENGHIKFDLTATELQLTLFSTATEYYVE